MIHILGGGAKEHPVHARAARIPPAGARRQEKIVPAVAVEVAHTILTEGVEPGLIATELDIVTADKVDRIVGRGAEMTLLVAMRKHIPDDAARSDWCATNLDRVGRMVLDGVAQNLELAASLPNVVGTAV